MKEDMERENIFWDFILRWISDEVIQLQVTSYQVLYFVFR